MTPAAGLFGAKGIALAAICNAAIVPTVNILCVLVFARHGSARLTGRGIAKQLATNPLVLGSFAGIAFQLLGLSVPAGVEPALRALGAASLPLGLLCVGAALEFGSVRRWIAPVAASSAIKFLAMPVVTVAVASLMGLTGTGTGHCAALPGPADGFLRLHHGAPARRRRAADGRHHRDADALCAGRPSVRGRRHRRCSPPDAAITVIERPDDLIRTSVDPAAGRTHAAAWALDFGIEAAPRVHVLEALTALPPRPPLPNELFLWFGTPASDDWQGLLPCLVDADREQVLRLRQTADRWSVAATRAGLRTLLSTALGCPAHDVAYWRDDREKPWLDRNRHGGWRTACTST